MTIAINLAFTQLAIEMIALDQWSEVTQPSFLGAVTTGNIWQFGVLHRQSKQIEQGLNLYRVTEDIEAVVRILLAALKSDPNWAKFGNVLDLCIMWENKAVFKFLLICF